MAFTEATILWRGCFLKQALCYYVSKLNPLLSNFGFTIREEMGMQDILDICSPSFLYRFLSACVI